MQLKAQALQLCKMLQKPLQQRMPFQGVQISKSLSRMPLITKLFNPSSQHFISLCISSHLHKYQPNTFLYQQQISEQKRYIYIILDGQVMVVGENQQECQVGVFGMVGYTEILFGLKGRDEKVRVGRNGVSCMRITEDKVNAIIRNGVNTFVNKAFHYLQVNDYFQALSSFEKQQLVLYMRVKNFTKGEQILAAQTPLCRILLMIHGQISIIRQIGQPSQLQSYKISTLQQMDSYGQYQCINSHPNQFYLIANMSGAYYQFDFQQIRKNTKHRVLDVVRKRAVAFPNVEELKFLYQVKKELGTVQSKVVKMNKLFV